MCPSHSQTLGGFRKPYLVPNFQGQRIQEISPFNRRGKNEGLKAGAPSSLLAKRGKALRAGGSREVLLVYFPQMRQEKRDDENR